MLLTKEKWFGSMIDIKIRRTSDFSELKSFACGIDIMDTFIHDSLERCVQNHYCTAYTVYDMATSDVIAVFSLSFDSLNLDDDDKDEMMSGISNAKTPSLESNYEEIFLGKKVYPALEISYLAVSEHWRNKHIGRRIVQAIVDMAQRQEFAGCQFITVEAMINKPYSAVGFYENCSFAPCEYLNPNKGTLRMFRTLYPNDTMIAEEELYLR